ncbi:MAG: NACHT domain-containing protein, partial [Armatimonadia bacterium]
MVAEGLLVATVAKFVARLWLSDTGDAVDAGIDLATLLSGRIRDRGERLEATAQVNALAREISSTVVQLVRGEDNPEVQAEQQQVILAIECAFKAARLSASSLVEMRLDGHLLAEHVLATAPPLPVGLSEAASETYRRAISATATAMIDCASTLPSYHEMVDKRVLSSLDALLRASEQQEDQFEARYRASAADRMDKLRIFGVDVPNADQAYSLSVAYVSLALEANEEDDGGGEGDADLAIETVLETTPRLLIRGPAGSGKTTLLQWIGVQTARRGFSGSMADWNRMVPFLIRLRNFSEGEFPQPENFARLTAPSVAGEMPPGWVHEKLRNGQAVVLIDGVDELPESKRTAAKEWLQDLNEAFGRATFVVTSREYATGDTWLRDVDFRTVNLLPMTLTNIDAFFHHWHEAAGRSADETTKNRLLSFEDDLKREIRRNRALRMIATSPLLCAMICTLYRARNQALPRHRVELYEACCSMLLERRDIERGIDLSVYPKLTYAQKKRLLSDLAYHMLKNEESEISTERARRRVYERLPSMMPGSSVREHDACFSFLLHRSGLLDEPVVGHVEFRHRTFQEYLAARAALDEEDLQLLIKHAHDDQWREVVLLAVGQASEKASVQLIAGLHERAKEEPTHRHCLQLLAISCLEAATSVPPSVQSATQACVRRLVPPSNLTDAKALATAGELAVPYLSWKRNWLAPCAAASVRCLTLIGTDAALEALESYIQDERKAVRVELLKADASFDGDEFRSRILKPAFARCKEWCIE